MTKTSSPSTHDPLKYIAYWAPPPVPHNRSLFVYIVIITSTLKWLIALDYETNSFNSNLLSLDSYGRFLSRELSGLTTPLTVEMRA